MPSSRREIRARSVDHVGRDALIPPRNTRPVGRPRRAGCHHPAAEYTPGRWRAERSGDRSLRERRIRTLLINRVGARPWASRRAVSVEARLHSADSRQALRRRSDKQGRAVRGDGESPFPFKQSKNGNFFGSYRFCRSSRRHFVDSLSADQRPAPASSPASLARSSCMKPRRDAVWMSPPTTRPR